MAASSSPTRGFRFAIDRGGTFTDIYAQCPNGRVRVYKLLSVDPAYPDAPREGIRRILQEETGVPHPPNAPLDTSRIEWIRMGTTVATNALLERKGEPTALVITRGFRDLLHIGNQSRPKIFDLQIRVPDLLYEHVIEVDERVTVLSPGDLVRCGGKVVTGVTGESVLVMKEPNVDAVREDLQRVRDAGIGSVAVVLAHSYTFRDHEALVGRIATELGFSHVSLSSEVVPMVKMVPRGFTACADAYLTPCIRRYLDGFASGFDAGIRDIPVLFMQSDGGLARAEGFSGARAIISGPAGGVVGYGTTTFAYDRSKPAIGFDMGGTSTDVSRYAGTYEHVFETTIAGVTIQAPQLDVNTVAAGGGSRLFFRSGMFAVGPESAGAHPGPACYRKGGPLTVTDANLLLGRLVPEHFPHIFGPNENEPLDAAATQRAFSELTDEVNEFLSASGQHMTPEEVALGFVDVANEAMCRPIRALTQAKGYDTSHHTLSCFGGAGGQHACAIARSLGMRTVFVHKYSGILSAYGLAMADVVHESQSPAAVALSSDSMAGLVAEIDRLSRQCADALRAQGFSDGRIVLEPFLNLRYDRTDCAIMTPPAAGAGVSVAAFEQSFLEHYSREFGFTIPERSIIVDDVRVRGIGKSILDPEPHGPPATGPPAPFATARCYFRGGWRDTALHRWTDLCPGHSLEGPAIVLEANSTVLVEPGCTATIAPGGDLAILVGSELSAQGTVGAAGSEERVDAVALSIFGHRFMSIAEQMGRALQRTSISTNIKERLDFSCALFGPDGGLVANAPHIPVHLGAMQEAVRFQIAHVGAGMRDGDVLVSNHPAAGGSHLPDITVITPVFHEGVAAPVFFVASRGHHADIGGLTPGSMPPRSTSLAEEGASIVSFKLVEGGVFQEDGIRAILAEPGSHPGCSGSRNVADNLSDLKAQVAANRRGIALVHELITESSLATVHAYMRHIRDNAERAVRDMLIAVARDRLSRGLGCTLRARDHMDDGTPIALTVTIDAENGDAVFDFTGTGPQVHGNCNAPRAVAYSAVIYCLRCMVGHDIPLNQGCLEPVRIVIPDGTILSPAPDAAVVGGNVLTSQRVVDVVLRAFGACAASQGCMNNLTFGDDTLGYYETIAGGAGAGPTWDGRSGVHTHMTNTRITDPEILERRYPVILRRFSLRPHSGGAGMHRGGDGVVREIEFCRPMTASILSERRAFRPFGLREGHAGARGVNLLERHASGRTINLGAKCTVDLLPGDVLRILTPGGGGYGRTTDPVDWDSDGWGEGDAEEAAYDARHPAVARRPRSPSGDGDAGRRPKRRRRQTNGPLAISESLEEGEVPFELRGSLGSYKLAQESA